MRKIKKIFRLYLAMKIKNQFKKRKFKAKNYRKTMKIFRSFLKLKKE